MGYLADGSFDGISDNTMSGSDNISRDTAKTETKSNLTAQPVVEQLNDSNILNGYRSVTYNFTLAGLRSDYLKTPMAYRQGELDLVILKSGGKGVAGMTYGAQPISVTSNNTGLKDDSAKKTYNDITNNINSGIISEFNEKSPGRFDMFIDNIELETAMSFTAESNTSLPMQIKFDVVEPYSINGFIEALQVAAIGAGYSSYLQASFVLKVEFWGYKDDLTVENSVPTLIPNSERYFPIGLTGIEVTITEKGTLYRCSAVPHNERAYGNPNTIKKPVKMKGKTVKAILTDLMDSINSQVAKSDKEGKDVPENNKHDTYRIKFPSWSDSTGWVDQPDNKIGSSALTDIFKDNSLYGMVDPSTATKPNAYKSSGSTQLSPEEQAKRPESIKYVPGETVIQFKEGMNISDAITAIIRDSRYVRDILEDVKKHTDAYGMIDYFLIKIETTNLDVIDTISKKPFQEFCYVVTPYKVHYTRIPLYSTEQLEEAKLKKLSLREYNYIYTGKNVDVLNFKLNFNTLFFEAVPASNGNKDVPAAKTGAASTNGVDVRSKGTSVTDQEKNQVPLNPIKTTETVIVPTGGTGGQQLDTPYGVMARNMHSAITDSKASMLTGELEILGDPFFLVTGGTGNYNPKPEASTRGKLQNGEAAHTYSELLITINFRNPIDIQSLEDGGTMKFDPRRVPFSGIYRINTVNHSFKEGKFTQRMQILRMPGQILDQNIAPTDPANRTTTAPAAGDQVMPDTTTIGAPSQRLSAASIQTLQESAIVTDTGGLNGSIMALTESAVGTSTIGQGLPTDMFSTIRLNAAGLAGVDQNPLASAALISAASNVTTNNLPITQITDSIASTFRTSSLTSALNTNNVGSGIGEGALVKLNPLTSITNPSMADIRNGANIDPSKLATGSFSNIPGIPTSVGTNAMSAVQGIGGSTAGFIGGVGSKINALSGISPNLQSTAKLNSTLPPDVNLSQLASAGVLLDKIPASKLQNIPATAPYASALPLSLPNINMTSAGNISNATDMSSQVDKIASAQSQLSKLTGNSPMYGTNSANTVAEKFGSNFSTQSPLDKLINRSI